MKVEVKENEVKDKAKNVNNKIENSKTVDITDEVDTD